MIPCFAHIGKQRLDLLVHETVGHSLDRLANLQRRIADYYLSHSQISLHRRKTHNVVPTPDRESHAVSDEIRIRV